MCSVMDSGRDTVTVMVMATVTITITVRGAVSRGRVRMHPVEARLEARH